jgi:hypothetical protein
MPGVTLFANSNVKCQVSGAKFWFFIFLIQVAFLSKQAFGSNETIIYDPLIRTILFHQEGAPFSQPIWELNSDKPLILEFDDLGDDLRRFKYTIVHCTSDWQTSSEITPFDYINGFNEENIRDFSYSYNTTIKYIHYRAIIPSGNLRPKISGNYILKVYDDDPANLLFILRFMVVEPSPVVIAGNAVQANRIDIRETHQQLDFVVKLNEFPVSDIGREVKAVIRQNGRWDNMLTVTRPRFIRGDELDYRYDDNLVFTGGNQFRYFDFKSLIYQSERIAVRQFDTANQVYLIPDEPRTYKQYISDQDLNGHFVIKNDDNAQNSDTEADYAWVHFMLPFPAKLTSGGFYIIGDLTHWVLNDACKLSYNREGKRYELSMLLKQGYYNYMYVLQEPTAVAADVAMIEGSHWETENEYMIYLYYRETGSLYDRLIAVKEMGLSLMK